MESPDFGSVRESIQRGLKEQGLPSLTVAVAQEGQIVWEEAFGWADRANRIPATVHTLYSLASISKPITTTALMILQERGKLDIDRPANDYLGAAKLQARVGNAEDATLRRVANHTSGLPLHYQFFYADEPYRRPAMDETIRRYGNLCRIPGERYEYSNLGYGVLDYVISRLSGQSYPDFMRQEVFLPLGMVRSSVDVAPELTPYQAIRYGADGAPYPFYDFDHPGGSAVYCSAHDLLRFGMLHAGSLLPDQRAILAPETLETMQQPTTQSGENSWYGVGWSIQTEENGVRSISHGGGMGGVTTNLTLLPAEKIVVVALANGNGGLPHQTTEEILAVLLPEYGALRAARRAAREAERAKKPAKTPAFKPDKALGGLWSGNVETYNGPIPLQLWFKPSGDVHAQLGNQLKALVNEVKFRDGTLKGIFLGDIGTEDANRRPYRLHLDLQLREEVLNGVVIALTHVEGANGGAPGKRVGNALSHWAELRREGA